MNNRIRTGSVFSILLHFALFLSIKAQTGQSVYTGRLNDPAAVYFAADNYNITNDGSADVTEQLQDAINKLKAENNHGIVFITEGNYLITGTVYIPESIRLIGLGKKRPVFILENRTPGFSEPPTDEKSIFKYMFCFTGNSAAQEINTRGSGTDVYYSAFSNIDLRIGEGNPAAAGLYTGSTIQGFVSHCDIYTGSGKAGIHGSGTGIENVRIFGGEYGIISGTQSARHTLLLVDTWIEGQRKAAIFSGNTGITTVGMHVSDVPVVIDIEADTPVRLLMENCFFNNIPTAALMSGMEENSLNQINLVNIECRNVPVLACFPSGKKVCVSGETYRVNDFISGMSMSDLNSPSLYSIENDIVPAGKVFMRENHEIPVITVSPDWVNIRELGAAGDGITDDTDVFREAIAAHDNIYVPQGIYRISGTLKLRSASRLVGLHPFTTRLALVESSPEFSGFGAPKAVIETSAGGNAVFSGIGISTGIHNYRVTACKWMAGEGSLMKDVVIGSIPEIWSRSDLIKTSPVTDAGLIFPPQAAENTEAGHTVENQYWNLWITGNGGGVFHNISAEGPGACGGLYLSNTSASGRILGMTLKNHIHNEARISNVSNWKIYDLEAEHEGYVKSGWQPVEVSTGNNITFAGFSITYNNSSGTAVKSGFRLWNCDNIVFLNIHNSGRDQFTPEFPVYDINRKMPLLQHEVAGLTVTGLEKGNNPGIPEESWIGYKIISDLDYVSGITSDSKGNVYFCETGTKRIFKWSAETGMITILAHYHWDPLSLACDNHDNLIVVFRYYPQPGYIVNGRQETLLNLPDSIPGNAGNLNSGWGAMAYTVNSGNPDETIELLPRVSTGELQDIKKYLYPSGRLRDNFDTNVTYLPATSYIAPDRTTAIPELYDLGRSPSLSSAIPGGQVYVSDAALKRTVRLQVAESGQLSGTTDFVKKGEFSSTTDPEGNVYIADGVIYIFGEDGSEKGNIKLDERPVSLCFGGPENRILFITTASSVYCIKTASL